MKVIEQVLHVGIALQIDIRVRVSVACQEFLDAKRIGGMIRAYEGCIANALCHPAPPTTSNRGTFDALVAAMIFEAFVLRNFTLCITTSCPASTAASTLSFCTSPETGLTAACPWSFSG